MNVPKKEFPLTKRAVSPEPSLLAHTSSESRGTFRKKARSLAPLNGWACAVKVCNDGMLEDTNSLDGAHIWLLVEESSKISMVGTDILGRSSDWKLSFKYPRTLSHLYSPTETPLIIC